MMKLSFVYQTFKQSFTYQDEVVGNIVIDSRIAKEGDVFFAIKGEHFDGHQFIEEVLKKGALAVIASDPNFKRDKVILVDDTVAALGQLAKKWRSNMNPYVLGITGSSGKTTVKELTTVVLQSIYGKDQVLSTQGNLNNHLGVPLTLLRLSESHRFAVVEMGMNHRGELSYLAGLAQPEVALVTNVLRAHIGCGFSGIEAIAMAKAEIFEGLSDKGIAVLPKDNPQFEILVEKAANYTIKTFGLSEAEVYASEIESGALSSSFRVHSPLGSTKVNVPLPGQHNLINVLAVFAMLINIPKISLEEIARAIGNYQSKPGRLHISEIGNGSQLIDDTYNANPDSMKAALTILANMQGQKIFVMGDMAELGSIGPQTHQEIGDYARQLEIDYLLAVGPMSKLAVEAFGDNASHYENKDRLLAILKQLLIKPSSILVKGSRSMKMEEVCQHIHKV